jgi:hypothetical protein
MHCQVVIGVARRTKLKPHGPREGACQACRVRGRMGDGRPVARLRFRAGGKPHLLGEKA